MISIAINVTCGRVSVVGIATGYGLDDARSRSSSPDRVKNFLFAMSSRPALGPTQPPIQWVPGDLSTGVKRQEREADQSPPDNSFSSRTILHGVS
jgi:hypothetical protein